MGTSRKALTLDDNGNIRQIDSGDTLVGGFGNSNVYSSHAISQPTSNTSTDVICTVSGLSAGQYDIEFQCTYTSTGGSTGGLRIGLYYSVVSGSPTVSTGDGIVIYTSSSSTITLQKAAWGAVSTGVSAGDSSNHTCTVKQTVNVAGSGTISLDVLGEKFNTVAINIANGGLRVVQL